MLIRKRLWFKSKWTEFPSLHDLPDILSPCAGSLGTFLGMCSCCQTLNLLHRNNSAEATTGGGSGQCRTLRWSSYAAVCIWISENGVPLNPLLCHDFPYQIAILWDSMGISRFQTNPQKHVGANQHVQPKVRNRFWTLYNTLRFLANLACF